MSAFEDIEAVGPLRIWDDVVAREVHGEQTTLAVVELGAGRDRPRASPRERAARPGHPGTVELPGRKRDEGAQAPGATWNIPSDVPHEVRAGQEGAVVIDVFSPARADWGGLEREDARSPHWPYANAGRMTGMRPARFERATSASAGQRSIP